MTIRSVLIGILLALFISGFTFFNDAVIQHRFFIGNHLPLSIFGFAMLLLLIFNPIMQKRALLKREVAVIVVLGLVVCGWPGSSFYRVAAPAITSPLHMIKTQTGWQAQNVMSYVPGGSPLLGQGHVSNWGELADKIAEADPEQNDVAGRIREMLDSSGLRIFEDVAKEDRQPLPSHIDSMTRALNRILESPEFYHQEIFAEVELKKPAPSLLERGIPELSDFEIKRLNRALLVSAFPSLVLPRPEGDGVMFSMDEDGRETLDSFIMGRPREGWWSLSEIPWRVWWPNIFLWGGLALLMGMASLCLALVVHRQWSKHELLAYPIPRFIDEVAEREPGASLPAIARNKLFWTAFTIIFGLHLLNGSAAWFEGVPEFPFTYDLTPLLELFPNARRVGWAHVIFSLRIVPTVVGFCFFLRSKTAFSIGMANLLWLVLGTFFISRGVGNPDGAMIRSGAFLGFAIMLLYTGRYYYLKVASASVGFKRAESIPPYAVWAGRGLGICLALAVLLLTKAGLPAFWAAMCLLFMMMMFVVMARIVSETGMFFLTPRLIPFSILTSLFGVEAIGPTPFVVMALFTTICFSYDTRAVMMPYLSNALQIGEKSGGDNPRRLAPWMIGVLICGFIVAGAATMYFQHNMGSIQIGGWAAEVPPRAIFNNFSQHLSSMSATGVLSEVTNQSPTERLTNFSPEEGAYGWLILGVGLVLISGLAYLRMPKWPLHPVPFLIWGTWATGQIGNAFLLGWAVKAAVVKVGGAKGYQKVKPLMVGLIAGELLCGILWIIIAAIYYFATGSIPTTYIVFPT